MNKKKNNSEILKTETTNFKSNIHTTNKKYK